MFVSEYSIANTKRALARMSLMAIMAALLTMLLSVDAYASKKQCQYLSRQLSSLPNGNAGNYNKYNAAAKKQATQIAKAKSQMKAQRCNFLSGGHCRTMRVTLQKMEANYRTLIRKRDSNNGASKTKRNSIKAKMASLRCGTSTKKRSTKTVVASKKTTSSGRKSVVLRRGKSLQAAPAAPIFGAYRTMCVRTCDGYYFPVSHNSSKKQFARDQNICNAMCPAAESNLYVHRTADQESEDMVSLAGQPYKTLANAFKYRTQPRQRSCTCGAANPQAVGLAVQGAQQIMTPVPTRETLEQEAFLKSLPAPLYRPDLYADIESQSHEASGLTTDVIIAFIGEGKSEIEVGSVQNGVRVVGPEFFPDPTTAIDLQAPAPTRVQ